MEIPRPQLFRGARDEAISRYSTGESLLAAGWAGLASAKYEAIDIHLRTGQVISGAVQVRIDGAIGEAASRRDEWTHIFAVEDVVLVRRVTRGRRQ